MKKTTTFIMAGVIAAVLSAGSAVAGPGHNVGHHGPQQPHVVTHVQSSPRPGHHHVVHNGGHHHAPHHHHHHHGHHYYRTSTGDWVIATAILLSALI